MRRLSSLLLSLTLALSLALPAYADTSYVVQPGDTLTKIAARFGVTIESIIQANHLANANVIRVGQTLSIPDGATPPAADTSSQPAGGGSTTYIVQSGDSLFRLAARFDVTIEAIIAANGLRTTTLQVGQVLIIPAPAPSPADSVYGRISGSATFTQRIVAALDWMQAHDMDAFGRVDTYVTTITPSPYLYLAQARPLPGGGCLVRALARTGMTVSITAALLYHEATHCYQFATVGLLPSKEAEVDAYTQQIVFMERNGFSEAEIAYYREVLAYYFSQPDDGQYVPPPDF